MSDDAARNSAAFLDAIRAVVLTLETEYEGQSVVVRYRPAIAVKAAPKFPADDGGEDLVVMELLTTVADLVVSATIGGQPAAMGRSAMKLRTLTVLVGLFPAIGAHGAAWINAECAANGPYMQRAARSAQRRQRR